MIRLVYSASRRIPTCCIVIVGNRYHGLDCLTLVLYDSVVVGVCLGEEVLSSIPVA